MTITLREVTIEKREWFRTNNSDFPIVVREERPSGSHVWFHAPFSGNLDEFAVHLATSPSSLKYITLIPIHEQAAWKDLEEDYQAFKRIKKEALIREVGF